MHVLAAARAEETTLEDAYVRDPLAAILAGSKAVTERKVCEKEICTCILLQSQSHQFTDISTTCYYSFS